MGLAVWCAVLRVGLAWESLRSLALHSAATAKPWAVTPGANWDREVEARVVGIMSQAAVPRTAVLAALKQVLSEASVAEADKELECAELSKRYMLRWCKGAEGLASQRVRNISQMLSPTPGQWKKILAEFPGAESTELHL